MSNRARINELRLNQGLPVAGVADLGTGTSAYFAFEVRTAAGVFVSPLQFVYGWQARREVNKPEWCQFSYPGDAVGADALVYPNEVWQYRNGVLLRRYAIGAETRVQATAETLTIEGDGILGQLAHEVVISLAEVDEAGDPITRTIGEILGLLFAEQQQSPRVHLGSVDSVIRNTEVVFGVEDKTILECINQLQRIAGGFFWVDTRRRLQWKRQTGFNLGNRITLDRNASQVQRRRVYRDIVTRMIGVGKGVGQGAETRVTVDDAAAQSSYGVRIGYYTNKNVSDETALTAATTAALARVSQPRDTYDVGMVDVSASTTLDMSFDANLLTLGTRVNIVAGEFNLWPRVISVSENGDNPLDLTLKFASPTAGGGTSPEDGNDPTRAVEPDLIDKILDIEERTERLESDTGVEDFINETVGNPDSIARWDTDTEEGNLPELMEDVLTDASPAADVTDYRNALRDFIEDLIPDTSDAAGLPVTSTAGTIGSSDQWAKQDHTHQGMPWRVADDKEDLDAILLRGEFGHTTVTERVYTKVDGVTICLSHLETI